MGKLLNKRLMLFNTIVFFLCSSSFGQKDDSLFTRLQAISNSGVDFFNVDGIEITTQNINGEFSKKNIVKKFKSYSIKMDDLNGSDSSLQEQNFYVSKTEELCPGVIQHTAYYFIETKSKNIIAITFAGINKQHKGFEKEFIGLIMNDEIPKSIYESLVIDSINFAGRKIKLGTSCHWMGINNVQCPSYGQMNWSVHKTLEDALQSVNNQYKIIDAKKGGKIISEDSADVIFEGTAVKAKKVVYDIKGIKSLLVGLSGGKTLTIYFVASPATQNFVSCVMSFWNNDSINADGLPPLLGEVMKLRK